MKDRWVEYMQKTPCPYKNGEELRARRRSFSRQGGVGNACVSKPEDDQDILEWHRVYKEAQAKRDRAPVPELTMLDLIDQLEQE